MGETRHRENLPADQGCGTCDGHHSPAIPTRRHVKCLNWRRISGMMNTRYGWPRMMTVAPQIVPKPWGSFYQATPLWTVGYWLGSSRQEERRDLIEPSGASISCISGRSQIFWAESGLLGQTGLIGQGPARLFQQPDAALAMMAGNRDELVQIPSFALLG